MDEQRRRKLPTGIQTFREIRETDCYYVDKTDYARRLAEEGKHWFLSRPRRFGKSLFVDTLKELFEGSEALFQGLAVHDNWDWSMRYPVLRLDFSQGGLKTPGNCSGTLWTNWRRLSKRQDFPPAIRRAPEFAAAI